jgi:hypothetical protein
MSENTQNQNPKQEQYSLNDDRRVKVLSPPSGSSATVWPSSVCPS